jgi:ABC-2 type transport system permease protein
MIFASLKLISASLAFFIQNSFDILYIILNLSDFAKYPITIFNLPVRIIFSSLIPFAFTVFYPASYFLGKNNLFNTVIIGTLIAILLSLTSYLFFVFGCKRYQSSGN